MSHNIVQADLINLIYTIYHKIKILPESLHASDYWIYEFWDILYLENC